MLSIVRFNNSDKDNFRKACQIREEVFVKEQVVDPSEEYDEFEDTSNHYLVLDDERPVATARWRKTEKGIKLERFAVLKTERGKGVGNFILKEVLNDVIPLDTLIYLHAQLHAVEFYRKAGFVAVGDIFEEAGIQHYKMIYQFPGI